MTVNHKVLGSNPCGGAISSQLLTICLRFGHPYPHLAPCDAPRVTGGKCCNLMIRPKTMEQSHFDSFKGRTALILAATVALIAYRRRRRTGTSSTRRPVTPRTRLRRIRRNPGGPELMEKGFDPSSSKIIRRSSFCHKGDRFHPIERAFTCDGDGPPSLRSHGTAWPCGSALRPSSCGQPPCARPDRPEARAPPRARRSACPESPTAAPAPRR